MQRNFAKWRERREKKKLERKKSKSTGGEREEETSHGGNFWFSQWKCDDMELKSNVEVPFEAADGKEKMKERMKKCDYINNNQNKIA